MVLCFTIEYNEHIVSFIIFVLFYIFRLLTNMANARNIANNVAEILRELDRDTSDTEIDFPDDELTDADDNSEEEIHDTDTEENADSSNEDDHLQPISLKGKNGHRWSSLPGSRKGRPVRDNIVTHLPGAKLAARTIKTVLEAWCLLISVDIINNIVKYTNEEIQRRAVFNSGYSYAGSTDDCEMYAFLGLFYAAGVMRSNRVNLSDLWSSDFGVDIFRATMSLRRFQFLSSCIRFDDKNTRPIRKESDKLAAIREVWDAFIKNCTSYYTPHEYVTIDEQLVGFRGKCPFKVYFPQKPDKYGMKIVMLNDAKTFYMVNAIPYIGAVPKEKGESVPEYYVRKLSEPLHGTNRNLTMDNWFTSIPIAQRMLTLYKLTVLGTLRKNKAEIPPSFIGKNPVGTSRFAFSGPMSLVSYTPKKNKNVLVLSTMHRDNSIDAETGKPDMILTYNMTKGGTDTFDQLCHSYSVARSTVRWPLRFWFAILDQAGINAMVLFLLSNARDKYPRRQFLKDLSRMLCKPFMERRLNNPSIQRNLKIRISDVLGIEPQSTGKSAPNDLPLSKRKRCSLCPYSKDRKTRLLCKQCGKFYCPEHAAKLCENCES